MEANLVDRSYNSERGRKQGQVAIIYGRTMTLHDTEELHDDLRRRTDENLALSTALGVDNVVLHIVSAYPPCSKTRSTHQAVIEDRDADHGGRATKAGSKRL